MINWISPKDRLPKRKLRKRRPSYDLPAAGRKCSKPVLIWVEGVNEPVVGRYYGEGYFSNGWYLPGKTGNWVVQFWAKIDKPNGQKKA